MLPPDTEINLTQKPRYCSQNTLVLFPCRFVLRRHMRILRARPMASILYEGCNICRGRLFKTLSRGTKYAEGKRSAQKHSQTDNVGSGTAS